MKSTTSAVALGALASTAAAAAATDVLFSKHYPIGKRDIDSDGNWNVSFFHVNDVHAHLDEFSSSGTDCEEPEEGCYGGYARIKTKVTELREAHPDNIWFNAGDEFQGTLFYSFYGPEKIAETVNDLGFDVGTLGNHEWDGGDEELGEYLNNLTFPIVSCNVKSEYENLKANIKNYHVFENQSLAVIGATTAETPSIADVGNLTQFLDPIEEIQKAVWDIRNNTDVKYIVALTHLGYDVDQELAAQTEGLSLIIGGHSHTLLGDMEDAEGDYPTIVENLNGDEVFVVTSYRWGEYLGNINVLYDPDGRILAYEGAPIHLDNSTDQEPELQAQIDDWRGPFEEFASELVGTTENTLDQEACQEGDCLLGQVMADAMLEYRLNQTSEGDEGRADFCLINAGGVRATIEEGDITRGDVLTSFPFGNAVVELTYTGAEVRSILEGAVSMVNQENGEEIGSWFQVSRGIVIEHNPDNEPGSRLVSVTVNDEPLDDESDYTIVTLDFLAGGGDNIFQETTDFATLDLQDEVLIQYFEAHNPVTQDLEERVVATDAQPGDGQEEEEEESGGDGGSGGGGGDSEEGGEEPPQDAAGMLAAPVWTALGAVGFAMAFL